jgi:ankyrin repeat protein
MVLSVRNAVAQILRIPATIIIGNAIVAAYIGNVEFAKVLVVEGKADVYAKKNDGVTPLDLARAKGNTAMILYLSDVSAGI